MFSNKLRLINQINLVIFIVVSSTFNVLCQNNGDFRSGSSGLWTSAATWETYNGAAWVAATNYPGQIAGSYAVTIQYGNTVTIPVAGITTQAMGTVYVHGKLYLTGNNSGVLFYLNTSKLVVTPNLSPRATIYFENKVTLKLAGNAVMKVWDGGLSWDNCNNVKEIQIGPVRYANCNGAPGSIFTFRELMDGGGTLDAISTIPPVSCQGTPLQLYGDYEGAIGTAVQYQWTSTGPAPLVFQPSSTSQNPTITPTIAGSYAVQLTVSTDKNGVIYSNTQQTTLVVAPTMIDINQVLCSAQLPYTWNGQSIGAAGDYVNLTKNYLNCDSTTTLHVTIQSNPEETTNLTLCESELPYSWNGLVCNAAGTYNFVNSDPSGCGTISHLNLTVNPTKTKIYNITKCQKELPYNWNGVNYTSAGQYTAFFKTTQGCDSIETLNLTVLPVAAALISGDATVCQFDATPEITFLGYGGTPPFTFTYKINNSANQTITTTSGNSVTLAAPTDNGGIFTYSLVEVSDSNSCSNEQTGNATITVITKPVTSDIYHQ